MTPRPPFEVTPDERAALAAACEALVHAVSGPAAEAGYWNSTAADHDVAGQILALMADQNDDEQREFRQLLLLLNSRVAGLFMGGGWAQFREMPIERRGAILRKWMGSRINVLRKAFGTLKKLTLFLHYGSHRDHQNATWPQVNYVPLRDKAPASPPAIVPATFERDTVLDCDVVIVGSGAGGGVAAGELAAAGYKVVVLEKGPFLTGEDFSQHEAEVIRKSYDKQGAFQTADGGITVFAGACLGGGTTINWTGAFHTPDYVRDEWARDHGLAFATGSGYDASMDRVMARLGVNSDNSRHNPQNAALWRGAERLGEPAHVIARNVQGCEAAHGTRDCGFCGLGCRGGHKRGSLATYLVEAAAHGATIVPQAEVRRILQAGGKAAGVEALVRTPDGRHVRLAVMAPRVVLAAGSIHTPALLLRSGITHPGIGRNLYLHPTVGVTGRYGTRMEPWHGTMMSAVHKAGMRLDGNYGYWIETPPLHPGVGAMALPWQDAAQHKQALAQADHLGAFIVLTRDKFGGRVRVDRSGNPVVDYRLHPHDRAHVWAGIRKAFRIHEAAGAEAVIFPHAQAHSYVFGRERMTPDEFLEGLPHWGWRANEGMIFTAHQMGTCAMGGDSGRHPVDLAGRLRALPGVYVADGSLLPTAAGVNPMMTIFALADWVVQGMK